MSTPSEEITPNEQLKQLGVTKMTKTGDCMQITIGERLLTFDVDKRVSNTIKNLRNSAIDKGLNTDISNDLEKILLTASNGYLHKYLLPPKKLTDKEEEGSAELIEADELGTDEEKENRLPKYVTCHEDKTIFLEAVIIGIEAKFAKVSLIEKMPQIELVESEFYGEDKVLFPVDLESDIGFSYIFEDEADFRRIEKLARRLTKDDLYRLVKRQWDRFISASDIDNTICAADCVFTYEQDKIGSTHFIFLIGDNDSGKSAKLFVFNFLLYRNLISISLNAANLRQFFGSGKQGIGTVCEDEVEDITEDKEKLKIDKSGYVTGFFSPKMFDLGNGLKKTIKYNTFGFRVYAGEEYPRQGLKTKGIIQRLLKMKCEPGIPEYDILDVKNHANDEDNKELLKELFDLRNVLLVYRLLHHGDSIPDIDVNLVRREKQLFKPVLRVFQDAKQTLEELKPAVSKYLNDNRGQKNVSLNSKLLIILNDLLKEHYEELINKKDPNAEAEKMTLTSSRIWKEVTNIIPGNHNAYHPQSYETEEFGTITKNQISSIMIDVFGAKEDRQLDGKNKQQRVLVFNRKELDKHASSYNVTNEIIITPKKRKFRKRQFQDEETEDQTENTQAPNQDQQQQTKSEQSFSSNNNNNQNKQDDNAEDNDGYNKIAPIITWYRPKTHRHSRHTLAHTRGILQQEKTSNLDIDYSFIMVKNEYNSISVSYFYNNYNNIHESAVQSIQKYFGNNPCIPQCVSRASVCLWQMQPSTSLLLKGGCA